MSVFTPASSRPASPDSRASTCFPNDGLADAVDAVLRLYERSAVSYEATENAAKDISHLLLCMGAAEEAIIRLQQDRPAWRYRRAYASLLTQLKAVMSKPPAPISSRVVYVEVPSTYATISLDMLRRLFPNIQKVWRIILASDGKSCLIEFASHSSARRAVDSRQQGHPINNMNQEQVVRCAWVSPNVEIPPIVITHEVDLPVVEYATDDCLVIPSLDWRRPRPRTTSECSKADIFDIDLVSLLTATGAFDDYPPLLCQLRL